MNIVFDLDSTLTTIEGIDELGKLKNAGTEIEALTNKAMNGEISLEDVFKLRLDIIQPHQSDLQKIAQKYLENITPGAEDVVAELQKDHKVFMVTGGYYLCAKEIADALQIKTWYSNRLLFDNLGNYLGIDETIPLWQNHGKAFCVGEIRKLVPQKTIMVGDGHSDLEANADIFICFSGVTHRESVAKHANYTITELSEIPAIIKKL
jgi:phosphoserine phosphatase